MADKFVPPSPDQWQGPAQGFTPPPPIEDTPTIGESVLDSVNSGLDKLGLGRNSSFIKRLHENAAGIKGAYEHPVNTIKSALTYDPTAAYEARDAARRRDFGRYALSALEAVPLAGPAIRQAEGDIRERNWGGLAGTAATAAALGGAGRLAKAAYGAAPIGAPATIAGDIQGVAEGARNIPRAIGNAAQTVKTAVSIPGTGRMVVGGLEAAGGMGAAVTGHPIPGVLAAMRGAADIQKGWRARQAALNPPEIPRRMVSAPPIEWGPDQPIPRMTPAPPMQGSNAPPLIPPRVFPAPPIQGSNAPTMAPPVTAPPPPIQGSNVPEIPPRRMVPPPAIEGSNARPTSPEVSPVVTTGTNPAPQTPPPTSGAANIPAGTGEIPSPVLNTGTKQKAANALSKEFGGKRGEKVILPSEDTSLAGAAARASNGWNKYVAGTEQGGNTASKMTPEAFRGLSPQQQAEVLSIIKENKAALTKGMAKGGVVIPRVKKKDKLRFSKRGIPYGSPSELKKWKGGKAVRNEP